METVINALLDFKRVELHAKHALLARIFQAQDWREAVQHVRRDV